MIDPCVQHSDPTNPRLYDRAAARGLAAAIVARSVAPPPRRPSTLLARALDRERSAPPLSSLAPRCAAGGSRVGYRRERLRGFLALRFDCPLPSSATTRPMPGRRRYGASQATDATFDLHWILRRNMEVSRVVLATAASGTRSCAAELAAGGATAVATDATATATPSAPATSPPRAAALPSTVGATRSGGDEDGGDGGGLSGRSAAAERGADRSDAALGISGQRPPSSPAAPMGVVSEPYSRCSGQVRGGGVGYGDHLRGGNRFAEL